MSDRDHIEGVVDEDRDLEIDTLTSGKPVELIPQHRSDLVEHPFVRDTCVRQCMRPSATDACSNVIVFVQFRHNWGLALFITRKGSSRNR